MEIEIDWESFDKCGIDNRNTNKFQYGNRPIDGYASYKNGSSSAGSTTQRAMSAMLFAVVCGQEPTDAGLTPSTKAGL